MKKLLMMLTVAMLTRFGFAAAIENVIALQRPGTGIVDIYYDLIINEGGVTTVSASIDSGVDRVIMESLSGDIGVVSPGPARHIVWDAQADNPERVFFDLRVVISASVMDEIENPGLKWIPAGVYRYTFQGVNSDAMDYVAHYETETSGFFIELTPVSGALWNKVADWAVKHGYKFKYTYSRTSSVVYPYTEDAWVWCNARSEMENLPTCHKDSGWSDAGTSRDATQPHLCNGSPTKRNGGYRIPDFQELAIAFSTGVMGQEGLVYHTRVGYIARLESSAPAEYRLYGAMYSSGSSFQKPLYCVRDKIDNLVITETFPPNYSSSFTIDTRVNSPTFPKDFKIVDIKSKYCDGKYGSGNKALFLSGVSCNVEFEADIYGGELAYLERVDNEDAPAVGEQISWEDGKFSLNVGAFTPGDSFIVRAHSVDGRYSQSFRLNFDVASQKGDHFGIAETQQADRNGHCSLIYRTVDFSVANLFDDLEEEAMHDVGQNVANGATAFTERLKSISFSPALDLYKRMDSSEGIIREVMLTGGDMTKLTGAQLNKIEKEQSKSIEFMKLGAWGFGGRIGHEYEYQWDKDGLRWMDKPGSTMLSLAAKIKLFRAWYGAASVGLDAGANGTFRFRRIDGHFEGGFETDELVYLKGTLGVGVSVVGALEGSLTGGIFAKAGSMYDPYWNELGLQIRWDAQWRFLVWSGDVFPKNIPHALVKWWWVGGDGTVVLSDPEVLVDAAIADAINDDNAANILSRAYTSSGNNASDPNGYCGFTDTIINPNPTSVTPVDIETDGMPGPNPQAPGDTPPELNGGSDGSDSEAGERGTSGTKIIAVSDDTRRSSVNRSTIIAISVNTNTTFKIEGAVWDDGTPDYNPTTARMTNGCSVVAWMNKRESGAEGLTLGGVMSEMEIAAAVWNDETGEWSHQNLTDNSAYDRSPILKTATNGTAAVAWLRNSYTNYIGSAAEPNQVCFARYVDGAWTTETVVVPSIGRVRKLDMAYDGIHAAIVFNEEDDPGIGTTQRLCVVTGDCITWGSCHVVAESPVNNSAAYAYYDETGGLRLVWNDEGAVKTGLYANGTLTSETIDTDGHQIPGDYVFTRAHSGRMALVWLEPMREGESAMGPVSMTYNPANGLWTLPCALTWDGKNKTEVSAAFNDAGDLEVFYATPNVATNAQGIAETVSSGFSEVTRRHGGDAAILAEDISFSTNVFILGETVDVTFKVKNLGDETMSNVTIRVYDRSNGLSPLTNIVCVSGLQDGQVVASTVSYVSFAELKCGQSINMKVPWRVGEKVSSQLYLYFTVSGTNGDVLSKNNSATWKHGDANVSIVQAQSRVDERSKNIRHVSARLGNAGLAAVPAGTAVTFRRGDANGTVLATKTVGKVLAGDEGIQETGFAWDISSIIPTSNVEVVYVSAELPESTVVEQRTLVAEIPVDVSPIVKSPLTAYSLVYDANGGEGTMAAENLFYDEWGLLASNAFTRSDYLFAGWALSPTGEVAYADGANHWNVPMYLRDKAMLYAVWTQCYYVDAVNGSDFNSGLTPRFAWRTLQHAADNAREGYRIVVLDGVYEPFTCSNRRLVIESANGAGAAIIDGGGTNRCATLGANTGETNTVLRGFTLRNGNANGASVLRARGGGVCGGTVENCLIFDNTGVCCSGGGSADGAVYASTLIGCTTTGNRAYHGTGDVFADALYFWRFDRDIDGDGTAQTNELRDVRHWGSTNVNGYAGNVVPTSVGGPFGGPLWTNMNVCLPSRGITVQSPCLYFPVATNVIRDANGDEIRQAHLTHIVVPNATRSGSMTILARICPLPHLGMEANKNAYFYSNGLAWNVWAGCQVGYACTSNNVSFNPIIYLAHSLYDFPELPMRTNTWYDIAFSIMDGGVDANGVTLPDKVLAAVADTEHGFRTQIVDVSTNAYSAYAAQGSTYTSLLRIGSEGMHGMANYYNVTKRQSINTGNPTKCFHGMIHQIAFWNRALTEDEIGEAFGHPNSVLMGVGTEDGASGEFGMNGEGAHDWTVGEAWHEMAGRIDAAHPALTLRFAPDTNNLTLAHALHVKTAEVGTEGQRARLNITLNGQQLATRSVGTGGDVWCRVPTNLLMKSGNALTLAYGGGEAGAIAFDSIWMGGSWQLGVEDMSNGEFSKEETYRSNVFGVGNRNMKNVTRSLRYAKAKDTYFNFRLPEALIMSKTFSFTTRQVNQYASTTNSFSIFLNGAEMYTSPASGVTNGAYVTFTAGADILMPGWNTINCRYDGSGGWLTFDFFRLAMGEEIEEQQETTTTEVPVPFVWLADYFPEATNATDSVEQQIVNFETIANRATGKRDSAGNPLSVWHDYVAGTDPTNMTSVFSAIIKMQDGKPVVGWSPKLSAAEEARRTYKVLGRKELDDANGWIDISTVPEAEKDSYRFFKVTVELP